MRILIVLHDVELSGAPRVALRVADLLRDLGHEPVVASPVEGPAAAEARRAGHRVIILHYPTGSAAALSPWSRAVVGARRFASIFRTAALLRKERFDVCWAASAMASNAVIAAALARKPCIAHVHETLTPTRGNRIRIRLLRRVCHTIAFVAPSCRAGFGRKPPCQKWRLLPNAVEISSPTPGSRERLRTQLAAAPDDFVFLTVGYLSPRKGVDVLLDAAALASRDGVNFKLWIVGGETAGHEDFSAELRRRVERDIALRDFVQLLGERTDVPDLLAACDAFVLASRNEAMPLSILEAMQSGRPVIATDVGSVRWMTGTRGAVIVPAGDAAALSNAMVELARSPARAALVTRAATKRTEQRFSPDAQRETLQRLLSDLGERIDSAGNEENQLP